MKHMKLRLSIRGESSTPVVYLMTYYPISLIVSEQSSVSGVVVKTSVSASEHKINKTSSNVSHA